MKKKPRKIRKPPAAGSFEENFIARFAKMEADIQAAGLNWTVVCKAAKISRAHPVRWRHRAPHSVRLLDDMTDTVAKLVAKVAAKAE